MTSRRNSSGFSCFTIDSLIGSSRGSPSPLPAPVSDSDERSTLSTGYTSPALQYVVSCSGLETSTTITSSLDQRQTAVDGGSRHAFRVYRPASLDSAHTGDLLETLHRRAMRWYSGDADNDHWRTPTLGDTSSAGRRISDIISTTLSSTGHLHSNC